jgi:hypothetical protein
MNMPKLMKLLPMLTMVASLACATYSLQPVGSSASISTRPDPSIPTKQQAAGKEARPTSAASLAKKAVSRRTASLRDPFEVVSKPSSAEATKELADQASGHTEIDPYPGMIQGLTLSGTFLQGRTEIAIISGQIYEKGQYLRGSGDEPSLLRVAQVRATGVTLQAGGNQYILSYPEAWSEADAKSGTASLAASKPRPAKGPAARSPKAGTQAQAKAPPRSLSSAIRQALNP